MTKKNPDTQGRPRLGYPIHRRAGSEWSHSFARSPAVGEGSCIGLTPHINNSVIIARHGRPRGRGGRSASMRYKAAALVHGAHCYLPGSLCRTFRHRIGMVESVVRHYHSD